MGLEEWLKALTEHWKLAEGLIIIAIVLAFPGRRAVADRPRICRSADDD